MLLFSITLFGAFWTKKEKEIRSWSTWFFWFASTVGFSLRKICFLYCRIIREFRLISYDAQHQEIRGFVCLFVCPEETSARMMMRLCFRCVRLPSLVPSLDCHIGMYTLRGN
jgi:hypothetical protein